MTLAFGTDPDLERRLRDACAELDRRLRAGDPCRAEHFFAQSPLLACHEDHAVELIYTEFVAREELGHRPTAEEFSARFPYWAERLRRQFQLHELLRDGMNAEPLPEELPPAADAASVRLGGYRLLDVIARGGCGVVYRAWQQGLDRAVALKVLRPEWSCDVRARQGFCQEARVMAALRHPHIMPVHEIGESRGVLFFSMDFAPGSLARHVPAPSAGRAAALLEKVARAVHFAHQQGVVHRDLKPSNVLLGEDGEPLVSDFGLAWAVEGQGGAAGLAGTPAYMAPEQLAAAGRGVGPTADVWALGVMLYELLTGRR
ncbi:MAG TPA: serine/threonine-protein kinase, partial [Gemmataceae bacterium]|nr:serine/threonine-protein kinase [Gemmataceae bacterium]